MTHPSPFPAEAGIEPALVDMFDDPVFHLLLQRDGLSVADVRHRVQRWRIMVLFKANAAAA